MLDVITVKAVWALRGFVRTTSGRKSPIAFLLVRTVKSAPLRSTPVFNAIALG